MIYEDAQRVAIMVDVGALIRAAKSKGGRVRFDELLDAVAGGRPLVRAIAYLDRSPKEQLALDKQLRDSGFEVRGLAGSSQEATDEAGLAVSMALEAAAISPRVDAMALVGPVPQLLGLVRYLRCHGVRVELWGFEGGVGSALVEEADEFRVIPTEALEVQQPARQPSSRRAGNVQPMKPKQAEPPADDFVAGIFDD